MRSRERERERVGLSHKWSYTRLNVSGWGGGDPPPACSAKGGGHAYGAGEGWLDTPPPDYWGATSFGMLVKVTFNLRWKNYRKNIFSDFKSQI